MSTGRIDVIAHSPLFEHCGCDGVISVSIEGLDPNIGDWSAPLTLDEARYLRDELAGAIEKHENFTRWDTIEARERSAI